MLKKKKFSQLQEDLPKGKLLQIKSEGAASASREKQQFEVGLQFSDKGLPKHESALGSTLNPIRSKW